MNEEAVKEDAQTVLSKHDGAALIQTNERTTVDVRNCELCNTGTQL